MYLRKTEHRNNTNNSMKYKCKKAQMCQFWLASLLSPLLVTWSPWVNGFTLSCSSCSSLFPPFAFPPNMSIFILFYFFHIFHRITLEIMTLQPKCEDVETAEGVAITVTGVAQVNHHSCLGMPVQTPQTPPHSLSPCPAILSLSPPPSLENHRRLVLTHRPRENHSSCT